MADIRCAFRGCKKPFGAPKIAIRVEDVMLGNLQGRIDPGEQICVRHYVPGSKNQVKSFNSTGCLLPTARLNSSLTNSQHFEFDPFEVRIIEVPDYSATSSTLKIGRKSSSFPTTSTTTSTVIGNNLVTN